MSSKQVKPQVRVVAYNLEQVSIQKRPKGQCFFSSAGTRDRVIAVLEDWNKLCCHKYSSPLKKTNFRDLC